MKSNSKETNKLKMLEEINAYVEELEKFYSRAQLTLLKKTLFIILWPQKK